uniref:Uncharacterized protein n=1 Tax=Aegilops tauschii subsp. strangulata TaxID=200361 RepID=A0A453GWP2_AEGTS
RKSMAISLSSELLSQPQQWQLLLLLALVSLVLLMRRLSNKGLKLPPGPARAPILGNLHQLGQLPHRSLRDLARQHGPVMQLQLGTVRTVVVSSAEAAREVMKTHDKDCCTRPVSPGMKRLSYGLKNVGFAPYGTYWHVMRKFFVVELFGVRHVEAAWHARQHQVEKLMSTLSGLAGEPVALKEHILSLADGIIGMLGFGDMYNSDKFPHHKNLEHVLEEAIHVQASFSAEDYFPNIVGRLVDQITGLASRRERIFKQLDTFFEVSSLSSILTLSVSNLGTVTSLTVSSIYGRTTVAPSTSQETMSRATYLARSLVARTRRRRRFYGQWRS